jgi:methionyl-tRNA formyltransferase
MKIAILTNETLHHARYVELISSLHSDIIVIKEKEIKEASYDTSHPFEVLRDDYEKDIWFSGKTFATDDFAETISFSTINEKKAINFVKQAQFDILIAFGVGLIRYEFISAANSQIYNLHGGNPEKYRGLDSHLWSIWHEDFGELKTCLHEVDEKFDTGKIFDVRSLALPRTTELHHLRSINTQVCFEITCDLLKVLSDSRAIKCRTQKSQGRYYHAMPSSLKSICMNKFGNFMKKKNVQSANLYQ